MTGRHVEHRATAVLDQALRVHAIPMKKIDESLIVLSSVASAFPEKLPSRVIHGDRFSGQGVERTPELVKSKKTQILRVKVGRMKPTVMRLLPLRKGWVDYPKYRGPATPSH